MYQRGNRLLVKAVEYVHYFDRTSEDRLPGIVDNESYQSYSFGTLSILK
jgi:hypothetical protein